MKRSTLFWIFIIALFVAFISGKASAQTAAVSATITDGSGQAYANGTWQATLTRPAGLSLGTAQRIDGVPLVFSFGGSLDANGTFAATMPRTDKITPSGYTWMFSICPNTTYSCSTVAVSLAGASVDLSASLSAAVGTINIPAAALSDTNKVIPRAYKDSEIVNPVAGSMYFNTMTGIWRGFNGTIWQDLTGTPLDHINGMAQCTGMIGNGVSADPIAACFTANPGKKIVLKKNAATPCSSGSGGGCIGTNDYRISSTIILGDGQVLECASSSDWPNGAVKIKVDSGIPGIILAGNNSHTSGCIFDQGNYWTFTTRNEYPNYGATSTDLGGSGEDGVIILGGGATVDHTAAYGFNRHGFFIGGHADVVPVWGLGGQPDGYLINGINAYSNRGWGVYIEGQDGNAGTVINPKTTGNLLGGFHNNSFFGGAMIGHMSHLDNRSAMSAGADGTVTSLQRVSNVTTYTGTAVASAALNTFVTCSGTTNFNKTMYVTGFTSTSNFQMQDIAADAGPDVAGTCHESSSVEIYALYKLRGGDLVKLGCTASNDGSADMAIVYDYCESNSSAPMYGTSTIVLAPHIGTLPAHNAYTGAWIQSLASSFLLTASQGLQLWNPTNGGNGFLAIRSGSLGGSTGSRGIRFLQHDSTIDFRLATLTTSQIGLDCGSLGQGITITKTGMTSWNPCVMTQDVRIGYNNGAWLGKYQIYTDTTKVFELDPTALTLTFGSTPSTTGVWRVPSLWNILARNVANSANLQLIGHDAVTDDTLIGNSTTNTKLQGPVQMSGAAAGFTFASNTFAGLSALTNGTVMYCSDCTVAAVCAGAGTGAFAKRINGAWVCN